MRFGATFGGLILFLFAASEVRGQCTFASIPSGMPPDNGAYTGTAPMDGTPTAAGATITIACNDGYTLTPSTSATFTCDTSTANTWDITTAPTCVQDTTTAGQNEDTTSGGDDGDGDSTTDSAEEDAAAIPNLNMFLGLTMVLVAFFFRMI
ncbi:uncharacterized protein LOC144437275 [Glandiceps talaboti]